MKEYSAPIWKFFPQKIHNPAWTNELNPYPGQWSVATEIIIAFVYSHTYMCVQRKGIYVGMIRSKGCKPKSYGIPYISVSQKWNCCGLECWVFLRSRHSRRSPFGSYFSLEFSCEELRQHQAGIFYCFSVGCRGGCFKYIPEWQPQKLHFTSSKLFHSEFCNTCPQHKAGAGRDKALILLCSSGHFLPSLLGHQPRTAARTPDEPEADPVGAVLPDQCHQFPSATRTAS